MRNLKLKYRVYIMVLAYWALILHAFVPHHHHVDQHFVFFDAVENCCGHSVTNKIFIKEESDNSKDDHEDHKHLLSDCSTIQHSLNNSSSNFSFEKFFKVIPDHPVFNNEFEYFSFNGFCIELNLKYPFIKDLGLYRSGQSYSFLLRGPPVVFS